MLVGALRAQRHSSGYLPELNGEVMDEIDKAQEREEITRADAIREASKPLAVGEAGECDLCGERSGRIVGGACAPCRDKYRLP